MRRFLYLLSTALLVQLGVACSSQGEVILQPMFAGESFDRPVAMLQRPDGGSDWYIVEKGGTVERVSGEGLKAQRQVFINLSHRVEAGPSEAGLLGMAFHPDFAKNGQVFLSYTRPDPLTSVLSRFVSHDGGKTLDPDSEQVLLTVKQPYSNHNGGNIAFGPDGYFYYGLGDGGARGDPHGNGQNRNTLLGAILRLDVNHGSPYAIPQGNPFAKGGGRPEIFAWGLRNPWRWSFDRKSGELWVADVGQNKWEEIDRVNAGDNLGWNRLEGTHCYISENCSRDGVVMPLAEYSHGQGCSVTGGYVYRGKALPELQGKYLYGDFCSGRIWELDSGNPKADPRILMLSSRRISSFAEDFEGELYLLDYSSGRIFRFVAKDV